MKLRNLLNLRKKLRKDLNYLTKGVLWGKKTIPNKVISRDKSGVAATRTDFQKSVWYGMINSSSCECFKTLLGTQESRSERIESFLKI